MTHRIASEEIVRLTVELSPSGMIMTDADGKILPINAEVERLFGYRRDELLGRSIDILVPKEMRAAHDGYRQGFVARPEARRMGVGRDLYGMRKDGSKVPVEIGLNPIHTSDGQMTLSAIADIERKLAVDALAARTEELQRSNADLNSLHMWPLTTCKSRCGWYRVIPNCSPNTSRAGLMKKPRNTFTMRRRKAHAATR